MADLGAIFFDQVVDSAYVIGLATALEAHPCLDKATN